MPLAPAASALAAAATAAAAEQAAAAVAEVDEPPRLFQLPEEEVERTPVSVQIHHLGQYKFKGNPQALQMVNVMLTALAGRLPLLPKDPPKGKGGRVAEKDGIVATCDANMPILAREYRNRVPLHILEHTELFPAVHAVPSSPRRQISAALRSASMPIRNYSMQRNRSPVPVQQSRLQDLQVSDDEGFNCHTSDGSVESALIVCCCCHSGCHCKHLHVVMHAWESEPHHTFMYSVSC
jgi:hypothetical protein